MKKLIYFLVIFFITCSVAQAQITTGPIGVKATHLPSLEIGSTSAGGNLTVNATLGANLVTIGAACTGWTGLGASGWNACPGDGTLTCTNSAGTAAFAFTSVVNSYYQINYTITGYSGSGRIIAHVGGGGSNSRNANGVYTEYVWANSTAGFNFVTTSNFNGVISNLSVYLMSNGSLTVGNGLTVKAGQLVIPCYSDVGYPGLCFAEDSNTGLYAYATGGMVQVTCDAVAGLQISANGLTIPHDTNSRIVFGASGNGILIWDAAQTLAFRNGTNQQKVNIYNTAGSATADYERLAITGVQTASLNLTAETQGTGADNLDIVLTPAGTGQVKNVASNITAGATGTAVSLGHINRQVYVRTYAAADFTDTDTTKGIVICTLPAKTKIVGFYADSTATFKGGSVNAATLEVGITAEGAAEIMAAKDIWTATATYGLADADLGTGMTRAAQIQGGYLPSWSGTTAIYATIDTTAGNLNALTTGSVTFYVVTERF